jgi:hypothetical protein
MKVYRQSVSSWYARFANFMYLDKDSIGGGTYLNH